jgi:endonuclease/exonuclease/phosphatase family metal-dependent hydrolase
MDRLRVVTINVWNRSGPWETRRELLRQGLRALDADLVGLQEIVHDAGGSTQAHELADGTGHHVAYAAAQSWGGGVSMGNAVISRWPILESTTFQLPVAGLPTGADIPEHRCLLYALVDAPWGPIPFYVTHLSWKFHEGYAREAQVLAIARHVEETAPAAALPAVLVGDFNAEPHAAEIRFLTGLQTLGVPGGPHAPAVGPRSAFFADAFGWAGVGHGATFDRTRNPFAVAAREPPRRIDYVFVRGPNERGRGEPVAARVVLDETAGGVAPSDHFGVLAEITVSR